MGEAGGEAAAEDAAGFLFPDDEARGVEAVGELEAIALPVDGFAAVPAVLEAGISFEEVGAGVDAVVNRVADLIEDHAGGRRLVVPAFELVVHGEGEEAFPGPDVAGEADGVAVGEADELHGGLGVGGGGFGDGGVYLIQYFPNVMSFSVSGAKG